MNFQSITLAAWAWAGPGCWSRAQPSFPARGEKRKVTLLTKTGPHLVSPGLGSPACGLPVLRGPWPCCHLGSREQGAGSRRVAAPRACLAGDLPRQALFAKGSRDQSSESVSKPQHWLLFLPPLLAGGLTPSVPAGGPPRLSRPPGAGRPGLCCREGVWRWLCRAGRPDTKASNSVCLSVLCPVPPPHP